jgi:heat shock protein HtpX
MPLTYIDIEKQKSWRIWLLFLFLLFHYLCIAALFTVVAAVYLHVPLHAAPRFLVFSALISLLVASSHFLLSAYDTVRTVVRGLDAQPPDPQDDVHKILMNVMQEIHVVTGNRRKIQCFVIPSFSLNALAVTDLKGEAAICITEGLLSRLSRPQLEGVIAHEAHHILSGDCLETSVAASLFCTFSSALEKIDSASQVRSNASPMLLLGMASLKLTELLSMFISREREYRADAAAVRLTRDPISLAETLYLLSRSWRGAGFIGSGFEMLCIVNPQATALDETEGLRADLFSTHPPLSKRIDILLKMARVTIAELEVKTGKAAAVNAQNTPVPQYYAMSPRQQWQGPFIPSELAALPWLSPLTWITRGKDYPVNRASKEPLISAIFMSRLSEQERPLSDFTCPSCRQPLVTESYEGTQVFQCRFCAGILVKSDRIPRIIVRTSRETPCSDRVVSLAKTVVKQNQLRQLHYLKSVDNAKAAVPLLACPKCGNPMMRGFYSQAHLIEVDRCSFCGLTWFDQDELEMLQCLIENRIVPDLAGLDHAGHVAI